MQAFVSLWGARRGQGASCRLVGADVRDRQDILRVKADRREVYL